MSLRFVIGRAGSGKSRFCFDEIKSLIAAGSSSEPILIVPEQFTLQAEKSLMAVLGTNILMGVEILSFKRLAYRAFNKAGRRPGKRLTPAGKSMLLMLAVSRLAGDLKIFKNAARSPGFIKTLETTITELKQYGVSPQNILDAAEKTGADGSLREKLLELHRIYAGYETLLGQTYIDADDELTDLAGILAPGCMIDGREIFIDGFDGFTSQEENIIAKMLELSKRVTVAMCTDATENVGAVPESDVFSPAKNAIARLTRIAKFLKTDIEKPVVLKGTVTRFSGSPEMEWLEKSVFVYPAPAFKGEAPAVTIAACKNPAEETEAAAREVVALCRDRGLRYKEIFVAARDLGRYEALVKAIFPRYDIPFFMDAKREIDNHPLVRLVLAVLEIFEKKWSYDSVFRYLKTGLTGISDADIDILENYVLAYGIKGSKWLSEADWTYREKDDEDLETVNRIRRTVIAPFEDFRGKLNRSKTARELCAALYEFMIFIGAPATLETVTAEFREAGMFEEADRYSRIWNIIMEVFDEAAEIFGDERISFEKFRTIISAGIAQYRIGLIPGVVDSVNVGSADRSKTNDVKAVIILGVNEGVFPMPMTTEGILSDRERATLAGFGIELAKDTKGRMADENFMVYKTLTTPSKYLYAGYPGADSSGRALRPSSVIGMLEEIFPGACKKSTLADTDALDDPDRISRPLPTFDYITEGLLRLKYDLPVPAIWHEAYAWYASREEWREKTAMVEAALNFSNAEKPLGGGLAQKLYRNQNSMSVSRAEKFAGCPFSYFLEYGIRAKERKIYRIESPDAGTMMHDIIKAFFDKLEAENIDPREVTDEQCEQIVSEIVAGLRAKFPKLGPLDRNRLTMLTDRFKKVTYAAIRMLVAQLREGMFTPIGHEIVIGHGGDYPPVTLKLDDGSKVYISGRIDRLDKFEAAQGKTYVRIVDYKSGPKDLKLSDVLCGLQIQLAVYLSSIWDNGIKGTDKIMNKVIPAGMFYYKLTDPSVNGPHDMTDDEIEQQVKATFRMNGLVLDDPEVIRGMDAAFTGKSLIIPVSLNKDGKLLTGYSSTASLEQFELLRGHVKRLLRKLIAEMHGGDISIKPYKKNDYTPCGYCKFEAVCKKELSRQNSLYNKVEKLKNDEVWAEFEAQAKAEGGVPPSQT